MAVIMEVLALSETTRGTTAVSVWISLAWSQTNVLAMAAEPPLPQTNRVAPR